MKIINKTNNAALSENALLADKFFPRIKGLLGKKELKRGEGIIVKPCNSIHTFFMKFPIDVLFVDRHNKIIMAIADLKPFRLTPIYFKAFLAVELPSGTIDSTSTKLGHELSFIRDVS